MREIVEAARSSSTSVLKMSYRLRRESNSYNSDSLKDCRNSSSFFFSSSEIINGSNLNMNGNLIL
jgi:hypothetical protein